MTPPTQVLCVCDGARVPSTSPAASWPRRIPITTIGDDAEITFVVENLIAKFGGQIAPRVQDLLAIAAYCFAADREVRRTPPVDIYRERWRREMTLCLPVAEPEFWSQPDVTKRLCDTLNFGTDDTWTFHFDRLDRATSAHAQATIVWDKRELLDYPDTVALFSGGTDSLCAVVDAVAQLGRKPVLVSHWSTPLVQKRQERLRAAVRRHFGGWEFPHVQVELHRRDEGDGEASQRSRGFLFAALGAAVAAHLGIATVLLPENGYVAINPRMNGQLIGALASRGTHPKFVLLVNHLLALVFDGVVKIENPLWDKTRAQALQLLGAADARALLRQTYSCGKLQGRTVGKAHCAGCSQCVDRRIGVLEAGLEAHDPVESYEFDLFVDAVPSGEATTVTRSYVMFAKELVQLTPEAILDQYRELDACLDPDDPDFDVHALGLASVLHRHAAEVMAVIAEQYRRQADRLARRDLDPNALLVIWQREQGLTDAANEQFTEDGAPEQAPRERFGVPFAVERSHFERFGATWHIAFRDEKGGLKNHVGAERIARILKASGAELESLDLARGTSPPPAKANTSTGFSTRQSRQGDAGAIADSPAVKAYVKRRVELERLIAVHQAAGHDKKVDQLQREHNWLVRELRSCLGLGDVPRAFPEEHEHARQTVSKTVHGEYTLLKRQMPLLAAHLETYIHLGYLCWYEPVEPETWVITL